MSESIQTGSYFFVIYRVFHNDIPRPPHPPTIHGHKKIYEVGTGWVPNPTKIMTWIWPKLKISWAPPTSCLPFADDCRNIYPMYAIKEPNILSCIKFNSAFNESCRKTENPWLNRSNQKLRKFRSKAFKICFRALKCVSHLF